MGSSVNIGDACMRVLHAVIPAAGLGIRMRTVAGRQAKEMVPVAGKPMIAYAVHDAALAGITRLYVVVHDRKHGLRGYLGSPQLLSDVRGMRPGVSRVPEIVFVQQPKPVGSGDALRRTRAWISDEAFAIVMPDFILRGASPLLAQMIAVYREYRSDVVGVISVTADDAPGFANVGVVCGEEIKPGLLRVRGISGKQPDSVTVEPGGHVLKAVPRWIVGPHFFDYLERTRSPQGEWDDTPAYQLLCADRMVLGVMLEGSGFDLGNPEGYRRAQAALG